MDARNNDFDFDFTPIGQAIKKARTTMGMTRDELARIVGCGKERLGAVHSHHVGVFPILFPVLAEGRVGDGHQCHDTANDDEHFQQGKAFIFPHVAAPSLYL